jgi:hypothetical protein
MAHFGGILVGWAFVRYGFHHSKKPTRTARKSPAKKKKDRFGIRVIRDDEGDESAPAREDAASARDPRAPFVTSDVDAILDKINAHGFQSLSDAERRVLEQSSRKLSDRIDRNT